MAISKSETKILPFPIEIVFGAISTIVNKDSHFTVSNVNNSQHKIALYSVHRWKLGLKIPVITEIELSDSNGPTTMLICSRLAGQGASSDAANATPQTNERILNALDAELKKHAPNNAIETMTDAEKTIYSIKGARGRHLKVFEDRCVITTSVTIGSIITSNASDGEKTIYYTDCIGVQFKLAGFQLGYLQLETASSTMNNRADNFFNENSFTFDTSTISNFEMEKVANYIRKRIQDCKQAKNTPVSVTAAISPADEIKKFKELLDMGVISQEEFDAKKKQLLGL